MQTSNITKLELIGTLYLKSTHIFFQIKLPDSLKCFIYNDQISKKVYMFYSNYWFRHLPSQGTYPCTVTFPAEHNPSSMNLITS